MMRRRRGFSLFELVFVMGLAALLLAFAVVQMRSTGGRAGAHGLAQVVAEDLRAARQEAIAHRRPVALIFPSGDGNLGHATASFVLEGEAVPRITRVKSYGRDFGSCSVFVGTWPTASPVTRNPALPGDKWSSFKLDKWLPDIYKKNYCFVFMPDGSVRTNDLPVFDDSYHLAVAAGVNYAIGADPGGTSTVTPGPTYFGMSRAGECYTVSLSPAGAVHVETGLTGQNGSITTEGSLGAVAGAAPPALPPTASSDPILEGEPTIYPPQDPDLLPPDTEAVVTKDQYLSLEVEARSPTGDQLYCNWQVDADTTNVGVGNGSYSMQNQGGGGRMEWDPNFAAADGTKGAWKAVWQWRPPPTAVPFDKYRLSCAVKNKDGGTIDAQVQRILIIPPGRLLFESNRGGSTRLWSMNEDGSQQDLYKDGTQPTATLNGSRIVVVRGGDLYLLFPKDPNTEVRLTTSGGLSIPCISPNGNWIAFREGNAIKVMKTLAGATPISVEGNSPPPPLMRANTEKMCWDPSGHVLLYNHGATINYVRLRPGVGGNPELDTGANPGPAPLITAGEGGQGGDAVISPSWSSSGDIYCLNNFHPGDYDPYMFRRRADGGNFWFNYSPGVEESMVERDPGGGPFVLEERPNNGHQICRMNTAGASGQNNGVTWLTHDGENTRPVWTR